jgi:peptidoglycan/LPS O-acetylase OafA/YrhL
MKVSIVVCLLFVVSTHCSYICDVLESYVEDEVSPQCMEKLRIVCNNPDLLWRMFDSSSKYPISGMSYSNNKDLGSYDDCIDINYEVFEGKVIGKYCGLSVAVVNLFLEPLPNPFAMDIPPKNLAQIPTINYTKNLDLRSTLRDATDDYSITVLSLCVPDQCTPEELGKFFIWGQLENISLVNFITEVPCMTKDSNTTFEWGDIFFTSVLALVLGLVVWCTAYDVMLMKLKREPAHPIYLAFSVVTNGKKILHVNRSTNPNQIQCLNGLRFISMMWVIAGHGFVAMEQVPIINYAEVGAYIDNVKAQYIGAAPISVDTFFFLSGFLLAFGYLKTAAKLPPLKQALGVPLMMVHRYLRLTPAMAMMYLTVITIYRLTGTGPLWDIVAKTMRDPCKQYWWSFFLYIQNYYNYDDLCMTHTWYLSADMQMFILAPLVLIPVAILIKANRSNLAIWSLLVLIVICVIFPMGIRFADQTIDNVYDTHSRFNNYLIGMLLAVIMRDPRFSRFPFHKITNLVIWCFVLVACVAFNLYYHSIIRVYEHTSDTLFYGLYRPLWCFSLAWLIYSCYHGYGGPVNWFLSLPVFQIGARLSYCMYLLHAVIQMYWVGLIRTPFYWGDYMVFYIWCGHFVVTMVLSAVWCLAFESPMITIEKYLLGGVGKRPQKKNTEG